MWRQEDLDASVIRALQIFTFIHSWDGGPSHLHPWSSSFSTWLNSLERMDEAKPKSNAGTKLIKHDGELLPTSLS